MFISNREIKQLEEKASVHGVRNSHKASTTWWSNALIYRVDIRSFFDSNNDGLGDIQGKLSLKQHILQHNYID